MKKLIAILLSMLMLCSVIPFATVAAADATTVQLSIVDELTEVNAGEEVQVQVDLLGLEDTAGLISILVRIDYDPDVFELVTYFDEDEEMWMPPIEVGAKYNASSNKYITFGQISEEGKMETCLVKWTRATATATQVRREEHFYTVTFKVKDDAPSGTYDLIAGRMDGVFYGNEKVVFADPINTSITVNGAEAPSCEHEYDNACDVDCNLCGETREVEHNVVAVEAKDATCTELGNIAYWYCDVCGQAWLDEACTQNTNLMAVKLPMVDHEYFYACDPVCMNCYEITNPDAAHSLSHVEAKDATCFENGNVEYWTCEYCGGCWDNEAATGMPLNQMMVVVPMAHDELTHVEAVAPTCFENGNIEYWYCEACGMAWLDAEGTLNTNLMAVVLPMAHNELTHVEAKAPTCYEDGNIEYWYCEACGYAWLDAEGTLNTNLRAVILPMAHGTITHVEAKDATCTELGNIEYWYCEACGQAWLDEACTLNTNLMAVKLPMAEHEYFYACDPVCMNCYEVTNPDAAHSLSHVEAVAATCYENGNIEYWTCEYCGGCWDNEAATGMPLNRMMVIVPAAHAEATHVEAVAPTCYENGNIEYWYCEACGQAWLDAECTLNTNLRAVILPMSHGEITHVEAKDATCTELGNIEFWYCEACGQAWLDEACTLNTNLMAVKLPMVDHTYDADNDADCNVCGAIREIAAEDIILFGGNSVTEIKGGLAFLFNAAVDGIVIGEEYYADYTNATVTIGGVEYKLVKMGAIMNNKGYADQSLDNVDGKYVLNIEAAKVFGEYSYAVRIVNIPEAHLDTEIIARPYFVYENLAGEQITVYGADQIASYNGVLND